MEDVKNKLKKLKHVHNLIDKVSQNQFVTVECSCCHEKFKIEKGKYKDIVQAQRKYLCRACANRLTGKLKRQQYYNLHTSNITAKDIQEFYIKYYKLCLHILKQNLLPKDNIDIESLLNDNIIKLCSLINMSKKRYKTHIGLLNKSCVFLIKEARRKNKKEVFFEDISPKIKSQYVSEVDWEK